jgi:hypothetical protein
VFLEIKSRLNLSLVNLEKLTTAPPGSWIGSVLFVAAVG